MVFKNPFYEFIFLAPRRQDAMYFLVFFFPALTYALLYILIRLGFNFSRRDGEAQRILGESKI